MNPISAELGSMADAVPSSNQKATLTSGGTGASFGPNIAVAKNSGPGGGELRPPSSVASPLMVAVHARRLIAAAWAVFGNVT